jgi:hypothetical protein
MRSGTDAFVCQPSAVPPSRDRQEAVL